MTTLFSNIFNLGDRVQMQSLDHRLQRNQLLNANIANTETPGYRALGYKFEGHLQEIYGTGNELDLETTNPKHISSNDSEQLSSNVFIRPSESVGNDGNTVDLDKEMAILAKNQILYQGVVSTINRKIGLLKYAIQGGR